MTGKSSWEMRQAGSKTHRYEPLAKNGMLNKHELTTLTTKMIFNRLVKCSRWAELTETLKFHVNTAHIAGGPTEFRMLNGKRFFSVMSCLFQEM